MHGRPDEPGQQDGVSRPDEAGALLLDKRPDEHLKRGGPAPAARPCLFLTLMFGPAGWLLYLAVRRVRRGG